MLYKLLKNLNKNKYKLAVISLLNIGAVGFKISNLGIPILSISDFKKENGKFFIFPVISYIKRYKPDIVHTWMYHSDLFGGLIAKFAGCNKVIWSVRNTEILPNEGVSLPTYFVMKLCASLSKILPNKIVCVGYKARLVHFNYGYEYSKMVIIGNGFDMGKFKPDLISRSRIRKELGIPDDCLVIGSIGRYNEYKDHKSFIQSAGKVAYENQKGIFLLVGRDIDKYNKSIIEWINETGFSNQFLLLGERSDIPALLNAMDIFCLHSISEGFPNVLGEAMCVGLPSVVTDVGDAALLLGDGGLVVKSRNTKALKEGLLTLIQASQEYRVLLGIIARKRIKENYSISMIQHHYEELYQDILST
jgi:glycosyltransferase involved in cell wall biosynthesis